MIIDKLTKGFETRSDKPNENWYGDDRLVIDDNSPLAELVKANYPYFDLTTEMQDFPIMVEQPITEQQPIYGTIINESTGEEEQIITGYDEVIVGYEEVESGEYEQREVVTQVIPYPQVEGTIDKTTITLEEFSTITVTNPLPIEVFIDGTSYGFDEDGVIEYSDQNLGKHKIELKAEGYKPLVLEMEVVE